MTRTTVFCHPDDIAAGLDLRALHRRGLGGLAVNVLYHDWVCWTPMSRKAPMRRELGGDCAVSVAGDHPAPLRPRHRETRLAAIAAARADMDLDAWTVSLHRDDLARHADALHLSPVDAFGTRLTSWICPSSDDAAAYLAAHMRDIAHSGFFRRVILESCHYPQLQHGGAHERDLSRIDPATTRLLELCFCSSCMARLAGCGHDAGRWRQDVADAIGADAGRLQDDRRMKDTIALRRQRILDLLGGMRAVAPDVSLTFADQPAIAGETFRTGQRVNKKTADLHAVVGFDAASAAAAGVGTVCLAYFASVSDVADHVAMYLEAGVPPSLLTVALRPGRPDCTSTDDLVAKARLVQGLGVENIAFYELAQMQEDDWHRTLDAISAIAA